MIPFFELFTAEDGTTRRPLVERVPECRPFGLKYCNQALFERDISAWRICDESPPPGILGTAAVFSDAVASDLCCMAAIRWLGRARRMPVFEDVCWESDNAKHPSQEARFYPDDASALNALAHAVADELGINP